MVKAHLLQGYCSEVDLVICFPFEVSEGETESSSWESIKPFKYSLLCTSAALFSSSFLSFFTNHTFDSLSASSYEPPCSTPTNCAVHIQLLQHYRKGQKRHGKCRNICLLVLTQQVFPHGCLTFSLSNTRLIKSWPLSLLKLQSVDT